MCDDRAMTEMVRASGDATPDERFSEALAPLLLDLWRRLRDYMSDVAAELGLPVPLVVAIRHLDPDRPRPMNDLAEAMGCDPSHVTGIADGLETHGLVRRQAATHDRRIKELVVTEAGERVQAEIDRHLDRVLRLAALNAAERVSLLDMLGRLLAPTSPTEAEPPTADRKLERQPRAVVTDR